MTVYIFGYWLTISVCHSYEPSSVADAFSSVIIVSIGRLVSVVTNLQAVEEDFSCEFYTTHTALVVSQYH